MISFIKPHLVQIYFALGSLGVFFLVLFLDRVLQKFFVKSRLDLTEPQDELTRGLQSLNQALEDSVITDEEYEKFSAELINKYPSDDQIGRAHV